MPEPLISAQRVCEIFDDCSLDLGDDAVIEVEGIQRAKLSAPRLEEHRAEIAEMLGGLSSEFKRSGGGGFSFLNGCQDANGVQWTGLQPTVERLFLLGMGIDRVRSLMPREMWPALPGGVPYYVVEDMHEDLAPASREPQATNGDPS